MLRDAFVLGYFHQQTFHLAAFILLAAASAYGGKGNQAADVSWSPLLWAVFLLNCCIGLLLFILIADRNTAAAFAWRFFTTEPHWDSWKPMIKAIAHLRSTPEIPVYGKLFFADGVKFQYPVSSLVPFDLLQRATGASWPTICRFFNGLSWWCVPLTGAVAAALLHGRRQGHDHDRGYSWSAPFRVLLPSLALAITFYPLVKSYTIGQIQTLITLYAALALLLWQREHRTAAGIFIGLCAAIKPQWCLFLPWALLRGQKSAAAGCLLPLAALTLASAGLYGIGPYLDYLPVLAFLSRHGEGYFPNQSLNGLLNRFFGNGNNLLWIENSFPPFDPFIYAATTVSGLLIIGMALFRGRKRSGSTDLALLLLSLTIASPIAWEHHYGLLLPVFALIAPVCLQGKPFGRLSGTYLLCAYLLASQCFEMTNALADTSFNFVQSYLFAGALMVLGLLYRITSAEWTTPESAQR